ncbi:uncharacterized protein K444DRAFT_44561 [Hyaloscypha bicolor E]|uniref:Uncharacterized protein n=1 Tax=Hyaloscypha bicolor E TaxID=1095630 RepID=A0A2J6T1X0_9HELO|nr:uncharacterized protein K444DRAFT_44561 [Hyaloscypha bicolor E]PMD57022.1 hypothetical protein K444DRAFT_44561 [Hyaloscypha bicolor E]
MSKTSLNTNEAPNETPTANSTPATPNTTTRLKWLLRLLFLLYPNTYSYFYLYFPIHRQYILNSLDVFLAITTWLLVESLPVAAIAEAVYQLEAGYGECGWEGT